MAQQLLTNRSPGGGGVARTRARLARAIGRPASDGEPHAFRSALRDYLRAARAAGLGVEAMLADVDGAWRRSGTPTARRAMTRDVLEVATLLELSAGEDGGATAAAH